MFGSLTWSRLYGKLVAASTKTFELFDPTPCISTMSCVLMRRAASDSLSPRALHRLSTCVHTHTRTHVHAHMKEIADQDGRGRQAHRWRPNRGKGRLPWWHRQQDEAINGSHQFCALHTTPLRARAAYCDTLRRHLPGVLRPAVATATTARTPWHSPHRRAECFLLSRSLWLSLYQDQGDQSLTILVHVGTLRKKRTRKKQTEACGCQA